MATIKFTSLCFNNGVREWFALEYKNKKAGQILLETKYHPGGSHGMAHGVAGQVPQTQQPVTVVIQGQQPAYPQYPGGVP